MAHLFAPRDATTQSVNPSPKRKRADSTATNGSAASTFPFAPRLDVLDVQGRHSSPVPDSPRSKVAHDFGSLELRDVDAGVSILDFGAAFSATDQANAIHDLKRAKVDSHGSVGLRLTPDRMDYNHDKTYDVKPYEIPETPQSVVSERVLPKYAQHRVIPETPQISFSSASEHADTSTPTPSLPSDLSKLKPAIPRPTNTPPPRKRSPSPAIDFYWRDSEITGHLGQDPDDDGVGINGVGFQPTPAIAYARTQKRRQQVMDWKAREARDARRKRSERRRGEVRARLEEDRKRVVRFA